MKKLLLIFVGLAALILSASKPFYADKPAVEVCTRLLMEAPDHGSGPATHHRAFSTGAPGETTCNSCHTNPGNYSGDAQILDLSSNNLIGNGYTVGVTHIISIEISSPDSFATGGIQVTVFDTAGNQAGFCLPPNTTSTGIAYRFNWYTRLYLEHDTPIIPSRVQGQNKVHLGFAWIPSVNYHGPVHIRYCGVLSNGDSTKFGDVTICGEGVYTPAWVLDANGDSTQIYKPEEQAVDDHRLTNPYWGSHASIFGPWPVVNVAKSGAASTYIMEVFNMSGARLLYHPMNNCGYSMLLPFSPKGNPPGMYIARLTVPSTGYIEDKKFIIR